MSKRLFALALLALTSLAILAACGGPTNLREFFEVNANQFQELVDDMNAQAVAMSADYGVAMSVTVEISGNHTLVYNFIYGPGTLFDPNIYAELQATLATLAPSQTAMAQSMRQSMGINTLYITIRYLDSDGAVLAESTFAGH